MKNQAWIDRKILRRMEYTSDQQGIMKRYLAEGDNWETHLERSRKFITACLEKKMSSSIAVLGSGWLLDLPFQFLCDNFNRVYLIDIVHPRQIIHKTLPIKNIHMVSADITGGGIKGVYNLVKNFRKSGRGSILDIPFQATLGGISADYIISLNILNQLDILLVDYLGRFMEISEEEKKIFRERIQTQHLGLLKPGRSCFISDIEEKVLDSTGQVVSGKQLIYAALPEGSFRDEWTWNFDTRGEYNRGSKTEMLVQAVAI